MAFEDMYQEIILDHYRSPRNTRPLDHEPVPVHENPTCGDAIRVLVTPAPDGTVGSVEFDNKGCAISTASASMMSELLRGRTVEDARRKVNEFVGVMRGQSSGDILEEWGDIAALRSVAQFPLRVKCATLAWHAVGAALEELETAAVRA